MNEILEKFKEEMISEDISYNSIRNYISDIRNFYVPLWDRVNTLAFRQTLQYYLSMEYRKGSHSTYDLKYHIIWCTKYRYRVMTGEVAQRVRGLIREVCTANYVDIITGSLSPDHVHMLVSVPPSISISKLVQYMKGKSSRKVMMEFAHLKKRYWGSICGLKVILL